MPQSVVPTPRIAASGVAIAASVLSAVLGSLCAVTLQTIRPMIPKNTAPAASPAQTIQLFRRRQTTS
jgi:hypothetical protein